MNNTVDITKLHDDRLATDFHEGDENGYIYTPSGGAEGEETPDGKALWVGAVIYVQYPEVTLKQFVDDEENDWYGVVLTEEEKAMFSTWREKEYPKVSWIDSGDDENAYADFMAYYQEGEDTERLLYRLCVANAAYVEIRNDFEIFYHGFEHFMEHVMEQREKRAEEIREQFISDGEDEFGGYAYDASSEAGELARCPYFVVIRDDCDRQWVVGCRTDKQIAQQIAGCHVEDDNEWVQYIRKFDGSVYEVERQVIVTAVVNGTEYTITGA